MQKTLHYDCFSGISGDMILSSFLDLGLPLAHLEKELQKLSLSGYSLQVQRAQKCGIFGTQLKVLLEEDETHHTHKHTHETESEHTHWHDHKHTHEPEPKPGSVHDQAHHHHAHSHEELTTHHSHTHESPTGHEHRSFAEIQTLIKKSSLSSFVKKNALKIFQVLAEVEGKVHGKSPEEVHFHEVGALDSLIDIVGACIGLEYFDCPRLTASTVELGSGLVRCAHGVMPVPAPATALLAYHFPSTQGGTDHEATTPTGAAFLVALADEFNPKLSGQLLGVGMGIGERDSAQRPNLLRLSLYAAPKQKPAHPLVSTYKEISANIDDMSPEHLAFLQELLLSEGAKDAWQSPIVMKKGRLGTLLSALVEPALAEKIRSLFFKHSSTLGLREREVSRYELPRKQKMIQSPWGPISVKTAQIDDNESKSKAEFEELKTLALQQGLSLQQILENLKK